MDHPRSDRPCTSFPPFFIQLLPSHVDLARILQNTVSIGMIPSEEYIRFKKFNVPSIVAAAGLAKDSAGEGLRSGRVVVVGSALTGNVQ